MVEAAWVALLWQHNANPSYKLASIRRYDDIVRTACWAGSARAAGRWLAGDGGCSQNCVPYMGSGRGWLAGDWPSTGGVLNITAAVLTAGFLWWRSGNKKRTQNVNEYMLVLALCLLSLWCRAVGDGVLCRQLVDILFCSVWNINIDLVLSQWVTLIVVHSHIGLGCVCDEKWNEAAVVDVVSRFSVQKNELTKKFSSTSQHLRRTRLKTLGLKTEIHSTDSLWLTGVVAFARLIVVLLNSYWLISWLH